MPRPAHPADGVLGRRLASMLGREGSGLMGSGGVPPPDRLFRGLVSVKGVAWDGEAVALVHNRRGTWELPGGKLEAGESFAACLAREFAEELGLRIEPGPLLAATPHPVHADIIVLIYGCAAAPGVALRPSDEHHAV